MSNTKPAADRGDSVGPLVHIAAAAWLTLAAGCSGDSRSEAREECFRVSPLVTLGGLNDSISISSPEIDVAPLRGRGWVVIDRRGPKDVLAYSTDGEFQGRLLPRGEGPGEISAPSRLAVDQSDSVWITDGRGRVQIVGPDGSLGRTIIPFLGKVHGFTNDGLPFELAVKGVEQDTAAPYVRLWTRTGQDLREIGPGSEERWKRGRSVQVTVKNAWAPSDTIAFSGMRHPSGAWVQRWTPGGVEPLITQESVWSRLADPPTPPQRVSMVGLVGVTPNAFLGLARIPAPTGGQKKDALSLGVLFLASSAGVVRSSFLLRDAPSGFIDPQHYFTVVDDESGLRRIQITRVELTCPA